jgi:hypothetical protein
VCAFVCDAYYLVVSSPPAIACSLTLWTFIWLSELKLIPHLSHVKISSFSVSDIRDVSWIHIVAFMALSLLYYLPYNHHYIVLISFSSCRYYSLCPPLLSLLLFAAIEEQAFVGAALRSLRLIRLFRLVRLVRLANLFRTIRYLKSSGFVFLVIIFTVIMIFGSIAIYTLESDYPDTNIAMKMLYGLQ